MYVYINIYTPIYVNCLYVYIYIAIDAKYQEINCQEIKSRKILKEYHSQIGFYSKCKDN